MRGALCERGKDSTLAAGDGVGRTRGAVSCASALRRHSPSWGLVLRHHEKGRAGAGPREIRCASDEPDYPALIGWLRTEVSKGQ